MAAPSAATLSGIGVALVVLLIAFFMQPSQPGDDKDHTDPPDGDSSEHQPADVAASTQPAEDLEYPRLPVASRIKGEAGFRVWSVEEAAEHVGTDFSKPLFLIILGEVYDVGPGKRFYGPGQGYSPFAGRDACNGFAGGPDGPDVSSDMEGLAPDAVAEVIRWRDEFYKTHDEYRFVGFLNERYYDEEGSAKPALKRVEAVKLGAAAVADARQALEKRFMSCNSRHEADKPYFEIWCDDSYHKPGSTPMHLHFRLPALEADGKPELAGRCSCVPPKDHAQADAENSETVGKPAPGQVVFKLADYPECTAEKGKQRKQKCERPQGAQPPPAPDWS